MSNHCRLLLAPMLAAALSTLLACTGAGNRKDNVPVAKEKAELRLEAIAKPNTAADVNEKAEARLVARAKAEAEADAKDEANWIAYEAEVERIKAQYETRMAKFRIDKDTYEKAEPIFRKANNEFEAATKLALAREFYDENRKSSGGPQASNQTEVAKRRFREIITFYPDTKAAHDAKALLTGGYAIARAIPAKPIAPPIPTEPRLVLPHPPVPVAVIYPPEPEEKALVQINSEREIPGGDFRATRSETYQTPVNVANGKTVYVRGYYRANGTYVQPHTRRPPGSGTKASSKRR